MLHCIDSNHGKCYCQQYQHCEWANTCFSSKCQQDECTVKASASHNEQHHMFCTHRPNTICSVLPAGLDKSHAYLDSQVIHNNTIKGRGERGFQLVAALPFSQDGAQGQAVAEGELSLPAAIQGEPRPQLCKHVAVTKPAMAHHG